MELSSGARIGVIAGAVGLGLAITAVRFCGAITIPAKPAPPSQTLASSRDIARETSQTEQAWAARFDKDALAYGVEPPTIEAMSRKLVMRADEGKRSLAPGEAAIDVAGLRLTAIESHGALSLVIENRTTSDLAYRVVTQPRPDGGCGRRTVEPYDANVVHQGGRVVRSECSYHGGMSLEISRVETVELSPLQAHYVSRVPPRALGADPRLAVGHEPVLPGTTRVCEVAVSQALRANLDRGAIQWRDLVDFYARHNCDEYPFPLQYRAFVRDGEHPLPAVP